MLNQNISAAPLLHKNDATNISVKQEPNWLRIHNRAVSAVSGLRLAYREAFAALLEAETEKIYHQFEVVSLYRYCVDVLGLPTSTAYDFVDVLGTARQVPQLADAILDGKTTVPKARRICSVITPENHKAWIELVCEKSDRIVRRCVAMANPRSAVPETQRYISGDTLEIKFAVSEEWSTLLTETKDLLSQRKRRNITTEEAFFILMSEYKEQNCPVPKAQRAQNPRRKSDSQRNCNGIKVSTGEDISNTDTRQPISPEPRSKSPTRLKLSRYRSRYRPLSMEQSVDLRDRNQCTHVDRRGKRCEAKRWLDKHHVIPFSEGGSHSAENLVTLCSAHHRMRH